jgi:hypothetical protein
MCSVTFLPVAGGYVVGMNRDESRRRPRALGPERRLVRGISAIFPSEPGGGTWLAVDATGAGYALVNWYGCAGNGRSGTVSRGRVIPELIGSSGVAEARERLERFIADSPGLGAFRLIAVQLGERRLVEYGWNGAEFSAREHPWQCAHWFSSGYDEPKAESIRRTVAEAAASEPATVGCAWLRRLHGSHLPVRGPFSICMHREESETVSYGELIVTPGTAAVGYAETSLCHGDGGLRMVRMGIGPIGTIGPISSRLPHTTAPTSSNAP